MLQATWCLVLGQNTVQLLQYIVLSMTRSMLTNALHEVPPDFLNPDHCVYACVCGQSFASQTGLAIDHAKKVLKDADAVAFDVDSTVICEEGIDRLADFLGQGKAVAELTAR